LRKRAEADGPAAQGCDRVPSWVPSLLVGEGEGEGESATYCGAKVALHDLLIAYSKLGGVRKKRV
jgi:hypothetical protein